MTKRLRYIVLLTVCSLLGVLLLQVYFGTQVYRQYAFELQRDAERALSAAMVTANQARINLISDLFARDMSNPELVTLTLNLEEEEPRIFVSDPTTGDIHVSIRFRDQVDSSRIKEQLLEEIVSYNRNFLEEGSVMYWTEVIGERLGQYTDSITIEQSLLRQEISNELASLNIRSDFELTFGQEDSISSGSSLSFVAQDTPATVDGLKVTALKLSHPGREILRRTGFIFLMAALIFVLIAGSFLFLLRFVRRQKQLSQLKDEFIDNVTHELLTPITTLKLALGTLRQHQSGAAADKYLEMSEQQAQRIAEVVDHILQVSFVDEKQAGLNFEDVALKQLLDEALEYHQVTYQKPLDIFTDITGDNVVRTDRKHLLNVFHNLIGNAIKYAPERGVSLRIELREHPTQLQLNFSDNGPGIPPHEQDNIFEKFHRVTNGQVHDVRGLGIGLYYARGILRRLGGALTLERSSPSGSTFSVILPRQNH